MCKVSNRTGSRVFLLGLAMVVVSWVQDSAGELVRWLRVTAVEDMGERVRWVATNGTVNEKRTVLGYLGSIHQGEKPDPAAADLVALFLDDENPEVLGEAAYYVGYLGGRRHIERVAGLMGHEQEDIRNLAASSVAMLARRGDGSFLPRLYPLLDDASVLVRMSAVEAIRAIADPVSVEPLLALLPSEPPAVQREIVLALGAIARIRRRRRIVVD